MYPSRTTYWDDEIIRWHEMAMNSLDNNDYDSYVRCIKHFGFLTRLKYDGYVEPQSNCYDNKEKEYMDNYVGAGLKNSRLYDTDWKTGKLVRGGYNGTVNIHYYSTVN